MAISSRYILGALIGIALVFLISLYFGWRYAKKRPTAKFDERQILIRFRAYRTAFWTLVAYLCLNGIYTAATDLMWADLMTLSFIGICLSITVFAVICICGDAYFPPNERPRFYLTLFGVIIAADAAVVAFNYLNGEPFVTNGALNFHCMNIAVVFMFSVLFIALAIKAIINRRQNEAE